MRVLVVTAWYPTPERPSLGAFVERDVTMLAQDHDVRVLHLAAPAPGRETPTEQTTSFGVRVRRSPMSPTRGSDVLRAARVVAEESADTDVVHSMAFPSLLPMLVRRPRRPWVHTEHWSGIGQPSSLPATWRAVMPVLRRGLGRPDAVIAVSRALADRVASAGGAPVHVIEPVVPAPASVSRREADGSLELVSVGGLVDGKQPFVALAALSELRRRGHEARLTWVGGGELRGPLVRRAEELGVYEHLNLVGAVPANEVGRYLESSDVFLLPTRSETFCVSAAEAVLHGRPVVIGDRGGHREFLTSDVATLVSASGDGIDFADGVEDVLRRTSGATAEDLASVLRERLAPERARAQTAHVYESVSHRAVRT